MARGSLSAAIDETASPDPILARRFPTAGPMHLHSEGEIRTMRASAPRGPYVPSSEPGAITPLGHYLPGALEPGSQRLAAKMLQPAAASV
jgi:hypothetical protein